LTIWGDTDDTYYCNCYYQGYPYLIWRFLKGQCVEAEMGLDAKSGGQFRWTPDKETLGFKDESWQKGVTLFVQVLASVICSNPDVEREYRERVQREIKSDPIKQRIEEFYRPRGGSVGTLRPRDPAVEARSQALQRQLALDYQVRKTEFGQAYFERYGAFGQLGFLSQDGCPYALLLSPSGAGQRTAE
jgi:hypothetical protein